ncbi:hypothetical protein JCM21900_003234 [Sporobolomyces salmonicolor]
MAAPSPTPSSEIIHLVSTFADTLDALPPSLTRSLSDLKELDAVLSGSLQNITDKLKLLLEMMHTPPPGSKEAENSPKYTPLERLKLLREVTENARTFQVGGEDKIRVATNTCETLATHTSHLSTLSNLLLNFLPSHLLPQLPAPSAPYGYPASSTPASSIARRQLFDYPPSRHPGQGSTSRMSGALGMVRDHYEMARGRGLGTSKKRAGGSNMGAAIGEYGAAGDDYVGGGYGKSKEGKDKDPTQRHPNQYTKKRAQAAAAAAAAAGMGPGSPMNLGGAVSAAATNAAAGVYSAVPLHPLGMTAVEAVKEKRRGAEPVAPAMSTNGNGSRSGSVSGTGHLYAGMASQEEYNMATLGPQRVAAKRKPEEAAGASKRRKKGVDNSPDPVARALPGAVAASSKAPRRQNSASTMKVDEPMPPAHLPPLEDEYDPVEGEDDADKTLYCFCQRVSFGEMIACDAPDCEHEWFHLSCVGLKSIPDGRWFCDECRRANSNKGKKRR